MSRVSHSDASDVVIVDGLRRPYGSVAKLFAAAARQLLIGGLAVAGVLAITGCSRPAATATRPPLVSPPTPGKFEGDQKFDDNSGAMGSPNNPMAEPHLLVPALPPQGKSRPGATTTPGGDFESESDVIASLINQATRPGPMPAIRQGNALSVAERAVAPLADTVDAIDEGIRVVVENLRNADTMGYKVSRTAISDGRDTAMQIDASQGELVVTERALDIAIEGDGFLPVRIYPHDQPDGAVAYTRNGKLFMNGTGDIVVGEINGYHLVPAIRFPAGVTQVTITPEGDVRVAVDRQPEMLTVGQISLAMFADPSGLRPLGGGLYGETGSSGRAVPTPPGARPAGRLLQGQLESSNLDLLRERVRLKFLQNWRGKLVSAMEESTAASPERR